MTLLLALVAAAVPVQPALAESGTWRDCAVPLAQTGGPTDVLSQTCHGIRPGALLSTPVGSCSFNFIFTNGTKTYAGTAGHCGVVGDAVTIWNPAGSNQIQIGTIAFSTVTYTYVPGVSDIEDLVFGAPIDAMNTAVGTDFALVLVDAADVGYVNAQMCYWGGPTGAYSGSTLDQVARHYGQGLGVGESAATRPRSGMVTHLDANSFGFQGLVAPGDSGSGIRLATGEALGIITHGAPPSPQGSIGAPQGFLSEGYGTRIDHAIALAAAAGINLTLSTAAMTHEDGSPLGVWPDPFNW